jgi:spore coat polysaccharide biosynthesis predicted glycosyltransferase SpsG/RimJ/RimL family protein N-acetyltransferase
MRVLLLCDGGGRLGVGHVIRSLALAEAAVAAGHDVVVSGWFEGSFVAGQLAAAPVEVVQLLTPVAEGDRQSLIEVVRHVRPDVLHIDSYGAPVQIGELVAPAPGAGLSDTVLSSMEDGSFGRRPADVVIDPTFGAELSPRLDDGSTWLLRGSRYTPVRRRVVDARQRFDDGAVTVDDTGDDHAAAHSVLVVMGGTDPVGLAPAAVELLAHTGLSLDVTVIAVGENADLVGAAALGSRLSLNILAPVDDLAAVMARQGLVISAAGTSVWELCCIGVPMALIWAVENQCEGYDRVVAAGAALGLGGPELGGVELSGRELSEGGEGAVSLLRTALTDSRARADLVRAGRRIVDGLGGWRVVRTWEQVLRLGRSDRPGSGEQASSKPLAVRPADVQDARLLWEWRNDPGTRASSRNGDLIQWDQHLAWLETSLAREDRKLLLVEDEIGPVGTVRWDLEGDGEWEVSITMAPERRGQSLARPLLRAAEVALSDVAASSRTHVTAYLAVVNVDNGASLRLFESSAYLPDLPPDPGGFMRLRKAARVA